MFTQVISGVVGLLKDVCSHRAFHTSACKSSIMSLLINMLRQHFCCDFAKIRVKSRDVHIMLA